MANMPRIMMSMISTVMKSSAKKGKTIITTSSPNQTLAGRRRVPMPGPGGTSGADGGRPSRP